MGHPEMGGFTPEQAKAEKPRKLVGVERNPDGSFDYSKAAAMLSEKESQEVIEKAKQRQEFISRKIKHIIEANPDAIIVDMEKAREYWGRIYDEAGQGGQLETQINGIYAQRYEDAAKFARERMMALERELNEAESEEEVQSILARIIDERDFAIEMDKEAKHRRSY